jgi:phosphohistidine phosphatase
MDRILVLIRHAKASLGNLLQSDFDRPLADRGERDAPALGSRLKAQGVVPDLIVSSTAKRAAQTAKKVAEGVGYDLHNIQWQDELYHCIPAVFEDVIYQLDDAANTVFIVAHNPGISDFVHNMIAALPIDGMPTCGAVAIRLEAKRWSDFARAPKALLLFDTPKKTV